MTSIPKSTLHKWAKDGTFPRPVKLGEKCVRWLESEVQDWQEKRIAARDES